MKLGSLIVSDGSFRLPCVYEFVRAGVVLYVGRSNAGLSRAFRGYKGSRRGGKHFGVVRDDKRSQAFNEADEIRVTTFDNPLEARNEERRLIRLYNPVGNIHRYKQIRLHHTLTQDGFKTVEL